MNKGSRKLIRWFMIINIMNILVAAIIGQIQTEYLIRRINENTNRNNN